MAKKPQKCHKISCISVCTFCSISITNIATPPTFFNTFAWDFEISFLIKFGSYFIGRIFEFRIWHHFGVILAQLPENDTKMAPNSKFKNPNNRIAAK